jgi:hypothetical protein
VALPGPNRPTAPPEDPGQPQPETCKTFAAPVAACGPKSLASKFAPKKKGAKADVTLTAKSGGPELDSVTYELPKTLKFSAAKKALGKSAGTLTLQSADGKMVKKAALKMPKRARTSAVVFNSGGLRVTLRFGKKPSVTASGMPAGVTTAVLALKGKSTGLLVAPKKCGALASSARMLDRVGGTATAQATEQLCASAGGKS